ncbi:MAG: sigma-70 family RNA polymerase sigma factor [Phycisphaerales bacterium]|nr:MAG: sigma-70 family RNA polymerase sigma factor [Phycisphaerales bacterium]
MDIASPAVGVEAFVFSENLPDPQERLRRVFHRTGDALYRFILVRVAGDRDAADDLLQQVCHVAARNRRMPHDDTECEAWLRGIARNLIRGHWRLMKRQRRHIRLEDAAFAQQLVGEMESQPAPAEALMQEESARQMLLAVTSLPAPDQQLVFAFYFEGRSQADIAKELGLSAKSVETRLYRVRNRLRAILRNIERT